AYRHRRHDRSRRRAAGHRPGHDDARDGPPDRALPALARPLGLLRAPLASGSRDRSSGRMTAVSADWVLPVDGPPIENGAVRFEDGRIVEGGEGRGERHYADAAILPGFVDAHSPLEYSRYAGFADGEAFGPWITAHMTRKNLLDYDEMLALARAGAFELLASGATTCADYSFSGAAGTAAGETGLRAVVYLEVFGADTAAVDRQFEEKRARITTSPLVPLGISPHAPYSCSLDVYRYCLGLGIPVGTHLAESPNETEWLLHGSGPLRAIESVLPPPSGLRPVATLEPVLGPDLLCAHCVELEQHEIELLADRRVPVAHCPRSNALLGCGIAPLAELRAAGVTVGLGTDSPASAPSFDMFDELRTAIYAARARERDAGALGATEALRLATADGARALRIDGEVGTLTPGKRAD